MKIIGAGFGRTGTLSTKAALEHLGVGPCYHFVTLFQRPQDIAIWHAAAQGQPVDWKALFADFNSTVDWPGCTFYKQLMDLYPDAPVLLNVRDPEKWYESVLNTIYAVRHAGGEAMPVFDMVDALLWEGTFHGKFLDKQYAIDIFERHIQEVKDYVPADRLTVFEVQQGWEPLCRMLGVEVPEMPFPRLNDTEYFRQNFITRNQQPAETVQAV